MINNKFKRILKTKINNKYWKSVNKFKTNNKSKLIKNNKYRKLPKNNNKISKIISQM